MKLDRNTSVYAFGFVAIYFLIFTAYVPFFLRFPMIPRAASFLLAYAVLAGAPALAVEQCRFIQAKPEREACYQRQESELAAKRKRTEAPRRDKTMEALEQMKHEDEALDRQIHGICRGC
jgi:hypothetical protein